MMTPPLHPWTLTPTEAVALQRELVGRIDTATPLTRWDTVAGVDVSYNGGSPAVHAGVVVWRASDDTVLERQAAVMDVSFPYIPGLLSFHELPALLEAFAKLTTTPDVVMFDGQGTAHPRRFGIACHAGLWLNLPTLGCAKSVLTGIFEPVGDEVGAAAPMRAKDGTEIGAAVRTKRRVHPVYVSPGHRLNQATATDIVLKSVRGYRVPEPTRLAHRFVNECRTAAGASG